MDLNQLVVRSFSPDQDIPRVLSLYLAAEAVDQQGIEISEQALRLQLNLPGHDPLQDRWVVEAPGEVPSLIASALVRITSQSDLADANIIVHPARRRLGLGSILLANILERARQLQVAAVQIYANARHPAAPGFLQKHAFVSQGAFTELRLVEPLRLPPVIWPYGYTMRTFTEVQDVTLLTQAMNFSYVPLWGHREVSENEMADWLPKLNQQGIFLVFSEKGRVIGICRAEPSPERTTKNGEPTGYIDAPGVVPQHRRLDLYRALVLTAIYWLHGQGQTIIELESWGDKLELLKMYRELGFNDVRQLVCYQLNLISGDPIN